MTNKATAQANLAKISQAGFSDAATRSVSEEFNELQAENGVINLMRTNFETDVAITGIKDHKKASLSVNKTDPETLARTVDNLSDMARGAWDGEGVEADEACFGGQHHTHQGHKSVCGAIRIKACGGAGTRSEQSFSRVGDDVGIRGVQSRNQ